MMNNAYKKIRYIFGIFFYKYQPYSSLSIFSRLITYLYIILLILVIAYLSYFDLKLIIIINVIFILSSSYILLYILNLFKNTKNYLETLKTYQFIFYIFFMFFLIFIYIFLLFNFYFICTFENIVNNKIDLNYTKVNLKLNEVKYSEQFVEDIFFSPKNYLLLNSNNRLLNNFNNPKPHLFSFSLIETYNFFFNMSNQFRSDLSFTDWFNNSYYYFVSSNWLCRIYDTGLINFDWTDDKYIKEIRYFFKFNNFKKISINYIELNLEKIGMTYFDISKPRLQQILDLKLTDKNFYGFNSKIYLMDFLKYKKNNRLYVDYSVKYFVISSKK